MMKKENQDKVMRQILKSLYQDQGLSLGEVCKHDLVRPFKLSRQMVYYRLLKYGIKPRSRERWWKEFREKKTSQESKTS